MGKIKLFVFPFSVFFVTVYTIIWSLWEPLPLLENCAWTRFWLIFGTSSLIAFWASAKSGFFLFLLYTEIQPLLNNMLQRLSVNIKDDSLAQDWYEYGTTTSKNPEIVNDDIFKKSCKFVDEHTHDSFLEFNMQVKNGGKEIHYFLKPTSSLSINTPMIYVQVEVKNTNAIPSPINHYKWLGFLITGAFPSQSIPLTVGEETVFISPVFNYKNWMFFKIDVENVFNGIEQWNANFSFFKIIGLKTRGNFELGSVTVYK